jgi:hypothetical protein
MIGVTLLGQLGNQMFQYAAARVQSERLSCSLVVSCDRGLRRAAMSLPTFTPGCELFEAFPNLECNPISAITPFISRCLRGRSSKPFLWSQFSPGDDRLNPSNNVDNNIYDNRIWNIQNNTWLHGFFQSGLYFKGHEERIYNWYLPSQSSEGRIMKQLGEIQKYGETVAVHVRLGDYANQTGNFAVTNGGWTLGSEYYEAALNQFPPSAKIALFSDDPETALRYLPRTPVWISRGNEPVVDLLLMSRFKNLVIGNSSFSWWAGWLNREAEGKVVAPMYHIGRHKFEWYPRDIRVDWWEYV